MNAMAAHGAVSAAPQIVVVNDGAPVEQVRRRGRAKLYVLGAVMLVPLIFGVMVGKISNSAKAYNRSIDDAATIRDDAKKVRDGLIGIQQVLANAKLRGKNQFATGDAKLTADLKALPPLSPNIEVVFQSNMYELKPDLVAGILSFYVDTIELNELIKKHVQLSLDADKALKQGAVQAQTFLQGAGQFGYGGMLEVPSDEEAQKGGLPKVKLVQLGGPVCEGDKAPSEAGCGSKKVVGFRYRVDELGPWGVKKTASAAEGAVTADTIVLLDFNKALIQLVKGGAATVAEASYMERISKIEERVTQLIELEKGIETRLNSKSNEGKRFTFFM